MNVNVLALFLRVCKVTSFSCDTEIYCNVFSSCGVFVRFIVASPPSPSPKERGVITFKGIKRVLQFPPLGEG